MISSACFYPGKGHLLLLPSCFLLVKKEYIKRRYIYMTFPWMKTYTTHQSSHTISVTYVCDILKLQSVCGS